MDDNRFLRFDFQTEAESKAYLRALLKPYFVVYREVWCQHLIAGNKLRIDYVARPKTGIEFPFDWFGLEVKRSVIGREYNHALKQGIDYTHCKIIDDRPGLTRIKDLRVERVYIFPGLPDNAQYGPEGAVFSVNRLAGMFHVGLIYARNRFYDRAENRWETTQDEPFFLCSSDRQWSPNWGTIKRKHNIHQRVGSGVLRVVK